MQMISRFLDWDDVALRARECYKIVTKHGKPVIVMEQVKGEARILKERME